MGNSALFSSHAAADKTRDACFPLIDMQLLMTAAIHRAGNIYLNVLMQRFFYAWLAISCLLYGIVPTAYAGDASTFTPEPTLRVETLAAYTRADVTLTLSSEASGKILDVAADVGEAIPEDGVFAHIDPVYARLNLSELEVERRKTASRRDYLEVETNRYRDLVRGRHADQSSLDKYEQDLDQAELQIASLDVEIERAKEQLARHTVQAPAGFIVIERMIEPGEWVTAGQSLATVGDFSTLVAPFALDEEQFHWLRAHPPELVLRSADGKEHKAKLHQVSPAFDPETRKINVELAFSAKNMEARGGQRVELDVLLPDRAGTLLVPRSSLQKRYEQYWLTTPAGKRRKVVLMGQEQGDQVRVFVPDYTPGEQFLLQPENAGAPSAGAFDDAADKDQQGS